MRRGYDAPLQWSREISKLRPVNLRVVDASRERLVGERLEQLAVFALHFGKLPEVVADARVVLLFQERQEVMADAISEEAGVGV